MDVKEKTSLAQISTTTPLYITKSPNGDDVIFTSADLVAGMGHLKSKGGKKFKPTKYKGHSLESIVTSDSFGKSKK